MEDRARFLAAFVKDPFRTASITPSTTYLAQAMIADMDLGRARVVVELGPGTGVFTRAIIEALKPGARLICFEVNKELARTLAERFPQALVVNDDALNLGRHLGALGLQGGVDCLISGLPWVLFSAAQQQRLLDPLASALRPGGWFATFAYSHAAWLPAGRRFRRMLHAAFDEVAVGAQVWRNFPPAFVYRCRRSAPVS
jgi:phosphatidylethanolamine/phosphatidyl-N-methylethanolamine N-methyltransferase